MKRGLALAAWLVVVSLSACAPLAPLAVSDLKERPAEKALLAGLRAYEDAQYGEAEKLLIEAITQGLYAQRDLANAHKYLAFIYCTSERLALCGSAFRAARAADAAFVLNRAEVGHPLWGPVYKKALQP